MLSAYVEVSNGYYMFGNPASPDRGLQTGGKAALSEHYRTFRGERNEELSGVV